MRVKMSLTFVDDVLSAFCLSLLSHLFMVVGSSAISSVLNSIPIR